MTKNLKYISTLILFLFLFLPSTNGNFFSKSKWIWDGGVLDPRLDGAFGQRKHKNEKVGPIASCREDKDCESICSLEGCSEYNCVDYSCKCDSCYRY